MTTTDHNQKEILNKALDADAEILFATIGAINAKEQLGIAPQDKQSLIEQGKEWVAIHEKQFRSIICDNPQVTKYLAEENPQRKDQEATALLIADLVVSFCQGIPAVYVAVLLVKIGLRSWCNGNSRA